MLRLVVIASLVLAASRAEAMGRYVNFEVTAWNFDGTSALVERVESSSGYRGAIVDDIIVTAGDPDPLVFTISDSRDDDLVRIDSRHLAANLRDLQHSLAAHGFCGAERAPRCHAETDAERADREAALRNLDRNALDVGEEPTEIATKTGRLVLVLHGRNGDESGPARVAVFARAHLRWLDPIELRDLPRPGA